MGALTSNLIQDKQYLAYYFHQSRVLLKFSRRVTRLSNTTRSTGDLVYFEQIANAKQILTSMDLGPLSLVVDDGWGCEEFAVLSLLVVF